MDRMNHAGPRVWMCVWMLLLASSTVARAASPAVLDDLARFNEPEVKVFLDQTSDGDVSAPERIARASSVIGSD
jgi:hypothetical protein